jgi:hypothetical protein
MTHEILPGSTVPTKKLTGDDAADYVRTLRRLIRGARLNSFYPDARRVGEHVGVLDPDVHRGLYDGVEVDVRTGLPTYREWTRVQTDVRIAADQLRQLGDRASVARKASAEPESIWAKQLTKIDYYDAIAGTPLAALGDMDVSLRRVDRNTGRASFHVVLDKLDASGLFVRYTIDVEQLDKRFREHGFAVDERDVAKQSEEFQGLIYKFTSLDSEFTFVKLATLGGLRPERVSKGIIGPIWFDFTRAPEPIRPLLADGGFVAGFSLDTAAIDVAKQRNNDPFATLAEDRLTEESRAAYIEAREQFDYRVFKDRKFVVPRDRVDAMRSLCAELGTKNIVYGI